MRINIKYIDTGKWSLDYYDGVFYCDHENTEYSDPCCKSPDAETGYYACGCLGQANYWCNDCDTSIELNRDNWEFDEYEQD